MQALIDVILPVFVVIGFGYLFVWRGWFTEVGVDQLMKFAQNFAVPCLLFQAIARLDLSQSFNLPLLVSFYTGAISGFAVGLLGGRFLFKRDWESSIVIGFCGLFSNSVLLGLPIAERAYGADSLAPNFAIIAIHAPFCYGVGMIAMEIARNRGGAPLDTAKRVFRAMFRNALVIGIALGFVVNLTKLPLPGVVMDGVDLVASAALPTALFGLGGVLAAYKPEGDMRIVLYIAVISLVMHPAIAWTLGKGTGLSTGELRAAVLTAAMAPGANGYVFANLYNTGKRVAATAVLVTTALSILTIWIWLLILP